MVWVGAPACFSDYRATLHRRRSSVGLLDSDMSRFAGHNIRILVSSSRMACSVSVSIFSASEGMRVVASSAESGVRVPAVC